jgi:quercetin 2,3-dioxygenase
LHYHELHTENLFCIDGSMTMRANGTQLHVRPDDFVHVPATTIHSYQQNAHYTRFFGLLTPGLFEAFFDIFSEPYDQYVFPLKPGPFHYDRVVANIDKLDVKQVEKFESMPVPGIGTTE